MITTAELTEMIDERKSKGFAIKGNTYPIRDKIKYLGGIYNSITKSWLMPDIDSYNKVLDIMPPKNFGKLKTSYNCRCAVKSNNGNRVCNSCGKTIKY